MKFLVFLMFGFFYVSTGFSSAEYICKATIPDLDETGESFSITFSIDYDDFGNLKATVVQEGITILKDEKVRVVEESVREGLDFSYESLETIEDLNLIEKLLIHSHVINLDPETGLLLEPKVFDNGLEDIKLVRSTKAYVIGDESDMGSASIVIAKDANEKVLGSFLGGFFVAPCENR